jgi:hypothetical protein
MARLPRQGILLPSVEALRPFRRQIPPAGSRSTALHEAGITFLHGDIRAPEDFADLPHLPGFHANQ